MNEVYLAAPVSVDSIDEVKRVHWINAHNTALTVAAAIVGPVGYLIFVLRFAVDALQGDEWNMIPFINASLHGHLSMGQLWSQYGEPRIPLVRLDLLAFSYFDNFDTRWAILFNALIWIAAYVIALRLFRRYLGSPLTPIPVLAIGLVWFSLVDVQNALWAFEVGWFLVVLAFVVMLYALLIPEHHRGLWVAVAIAAAVVATLSWIQGFVAWPIGAICLLWWRPGGVKPTRAVIIWIGATLATIGVYLIGYNFNLTSCTHDFGCKPTNPITHPVSAAHFFVVLVGNVVPWSQSTSTSYNYLQFFAVGIVLLIASVWVLVQSWCFRRTSEQIPLPLLFIGFALLFDFTIMWGRLGAGLAAATGGNRYVMPNIVLLVGIVMYAWAHRPWKVNVSPDQSWKMILPLTGFVCVALLVFAQVSLATNFGVGRAQLTNAINAGSARVAVNFYRIPPDERTCMADGFFIDTHDFPLLAEDKLGEFTPDAYAYYRNQGPPPVLWTCFPASPAG
jgi:hypothetical protein